jgi:hypothetical protein
MRLNEIAQKMGPEAKNAVVFNAEIYLELRLFKAASFKLWDDRVGVSAYKTL